MFGASTFTYEYEDIRRPLETYEWDNTWIEHANDTTSKRVLYIGDSISCGVRRIATEVTKEEIMFDGFGTSKGIDNPYLVDSVRLFASQEPKQDAVLFNNGLHGWHLEDETRYKEHFEATIKALLDNFKDTPVMVVLTTYIAGKDRNNRVIARNKAAAEVAKKYNLPVIDLYTESEKYKKFLKSDGVHFLKQGYVKLAKKIVSEVKNQIK